MNQRTRARLVRELDVLKRQIRMHPLQVSYGRCADLSLSEYIAAIKRRDELEALLTKG